MVLGEYAAREFNAVDAAIKTAEYSEGHETAPRSPSVVASSADRSIAALDNGAAVAAGEVEIENPDQPLGERVLTLTGSDDRADILRWDAAAIGQWADPAVREEVRKRVKLDMTVVTTDQSASARTRSGEGFVVVDFEELAGGPF